MATKAKLFDIKRFPLDLFRVLAGPWIFLGIRPKVTYVGERAKEIRHYKGGGIIVSPHICFADPVVMGVAFIYRRLSYLIASFILEKQPQGFLLKAGGCIPINRDIADIQSIKQTVSYLNKGYLIGIYPEGHINRNDDHVEPYKMGPAMMASQANVPLIPIYYKRRRHWWNRYRIYVGEMVYPNIAEGSKPSLKDIQKMNEQVYQETLMLREEYLKCVKKKYLKD